MLDDSGHGSLSLAAAGADDSAVGERRRQSAFAGLIEDTCEQAFVDVEKLAVDKQSGRVEDVDHSGQADRQVVNDLACILLADRVCPRV